MDRLIGIFKLYYVLWLALAVILIPLMRVYMCYLHGNRLYNLPTTSRRSSAGTLFASSFFDIYSFFLFFSSTVRLDQERYAIADFF